MERENVEAILLDLRIILRIDRKKNYIHYMLSCTIAILQYANVIHD